MTDQPKNHINHTEAQLIHQELFHFLTKEERKILLDHAKKITLKKNHVLMQEGDISNSFFVILSGKLKIMKHAKKKKFEHQLGFLKSGDTVGEMALIEHTPRSVTVKASQPSVLLEFNVDDIKQYPLIDQKISLYLCRRTARRLRYLSEVTVLSMEKELEAAKKHGALGLLMVTVLSLISIYMLSLRFLENMKMHLPVTTIISGPMVIIIVAIMLAVMKKSGFPWKMYGIRWKNWQHHTLEALWMSVPVIIVLMAIKWLVIHWILKNPSLPLIDPKSSLQYDAHFSLSLYFISLIAYIILAPLQELIVRGALQSGFYVFLLGTEKKRLWIAIIISNLIFSLPHLYNSPYFALTVLIPGFFWGWLFARQKTLVGVSVSHIFIGVWMVFIVGIEQTLTQLGTFL
jgi:CRP-like cAMP-binding protein